jgi:hypothetical protein
MITQFQDRKAQAETITPEKIVLNADGNYPREVIFYVGPDETIKYRLVKTKSNRLILN